MYRGRKSLQLKIPRIRKGTTPSASAARKKIRREKKKVPLHKDLRELEINLDKEI